MQLRAGIIAPGQLEPGHSKMPFSPALKDQVKRMAAFRCCRCQEIGIDIHHILPQAKGGSDDIDNAAPLCQNCHDRFGANPEKRKEIRQMREFWYDVVKEKYHGDQSAFEKLNETLLKIQASLQESNQAEMDKLRSEVIEEVKVIRGLQEQAAERLKYVPVVDIPRQANTVVGSSANTIVWEPGLPDTLRKVILK
jgi:HNH endonuclease